MRDIPAFPQDLAGRRSDDPSLQGATLRDYFAVKVLPAIYTEFIAGVRAGDYPISSGWEGGIASDAYRIADAMLKTRDAHQEGADK